MWIVRLALRRPYTFVVASLLIFILGIYMIFFEMPTDIFPVIDIPVVAVAFNYAGFSPVEMDNRITTPYEKILTTTVNDIEHTETQSLNGASIVKIYFQKNAKIEVAIAQVAAVSQTATRFNAAGDSAAADHSIQRVERANSAIVAQQRYDSGAAVI